MRTSSAGWSMRAAPGSPPAIPTGTSGVSRSRTQTGTGLSCPVSPGPDLACPVGPGWAAGSGALVLGAGWLVRRRRPGARRELQQAAFKDDWHEQPAVAMLVEQHRHLVLVVTLHGALPPPFAQHAGADGERDVPAHRLSVCEVVVAVPAG